jgi:probable rRNA maturation factor
VDADEMSRLNHQYRGVEGPTDVLSFGCDEPCPTPGDEPITLGDVVIAPEEAERQAAELGHSVEHELDVLLVHGILHLLGYDHEAEGDSGAMAAREAAILDAYAGG